MRGLDRPDMGDEKKKKTGVGSEFVTGALFGHILTAQKFVISHIYKVDLFSRFHTSLPTLFPFFSITPFLYSQCALF
jgi:hypothetical protein